MIPAGRSSYRPFIISSHRNLRAEDGGKYCISIHHESPYLYFCSPELLTPPFHALLSFFIQFKFIYSPFPLSRNLLLSSRLSRPPDEEILLAPSLLAHLRLRAFRAPS